MEVSSKRVISLVFLAYFIREVWVVIPFSENLITPFPLSDQQISLQTYIWIGGLYSFMLILSHLLCVISTLTIFRVLFYLQLAEFIEYWLNYNNPWFTLPIGINVNVTNIRYFVLFFYGIYNLAGWMKSGKK